MKVGSALRTWLRAEAAREYGLDAHLTLLELEWVAKSDSLGRIFGRPLDSEPRARILSRAREPSADKHIHGRDCDWPPDPERPICCEIGDYSGRCLVYVGTMQYRYAD